MVDMTSTITAKSDQMNADDLIGGSVTIKITKISATSDAQQPISLHYEGDEGKPYKPCKSMRRVLVGAWGINGQAYIGRSLTLYRDDKVRFGGIEVGGIRISHMSDIDKPITMALTASKANKKAFTVQPLKTGEKVTTKKELTLEQAQELITNAANNGLKALGEAWKKLSAEQQKHLTQKKDELKVIAEAVDDVASKEDLTTKGE